MFFFLIAFFVILILLLYYLKLRQCYQYFKVRGIPTPPFRFFYGHFQTLWNVPSYHRQLESWTKQYGKIYGVYEGSLPVFVVSDPEFLHEVFIGQFSVFNARKPTFIDDIMPCTFLLSGDEWRRHRHLLNPAFTISKLKMMSPLINGCISDLMKILSNQAETGEEFNIYLYYKRMTMDVICRCAFGLDFKLQENPDNIYLQKIQETFGDNLFTDNLVARLVLLIPEFGYVVNRIFPLLSSAKTLMNTKFLPLISKTKQLEELPIMWFINRVKSIVDQRIQRPTEQVDLLQLMSQALIKKDTTPNVNEKKDWLTEKEVVGNIINFLTAGYETTSTALALLMYELARHPDILEKLQDEIDQLEFNSDPNNDDENAMTYPDYDIVSQLPYMDMVISEILRMYPIANSAIQRRALDDTVIKGIHIQKGTVIQGDMYSVHFDPDLWGPDDPYSFIPERHQTKRHSMAYFPFGAGPRTCIGMCFALIEMKILLTRLLRDYNIVPGEHLESKFKILDRTTITPQEIWIKLAKRTL